MEKVFLHFVAINFHERALADRLTENRAALKALDRLSNAQPVSAKRVYGRKGHKHSSLGNSVDLFNTQPKSGPSSVEGSPILEKDLKDIGGRNARKRQRKKARSD